MNTEFIATNLRRFTFQNTRMKQWVESNSSGRVLNLFCGPTRLNLDELRIDINAEESSADIHSDALDAARELANNGESFNTIILDPPYSYRKSMEMYNGHYCSRFAQLADAVSSLVRQNSAVISFGYHSTFMGKLRGFELSKLCVFGHGGAQHCTIAIVERNG